MMLVSGRPLICVAGLAQLKLVKEHAVEGLFHSGLCKTMLRRRCPKIATCTQKTLPQGLLSTRSGKVSHFTHFTLCESSKAYNTLL